jgi:predicted aspartyl protease
VRGRVVSGGREAVIPLTIMGASGDSHEIEAVMDTGFTGHLTLPPESIRSLSLVAQGFVEANLADGSTTTLDVYEANVLRHGEYIRAPVYETEGGSLAGMSLLSGSRLTVDAIPGGEVTIRPI